MSRRIARFDIGCCRNRRFVATALLAFLLAPTMARADDSTKTTTAAAKAPARKPTPAETNAKAAALVQEALYYEIYGDAAQRDRLLAEALDAVPNFAPAMWQRGYVRDGKKWVTIDDVASRSATSSGLKRYLEKREEIFDTAAGHLELARWCESSGLVDQAKAHFGTVLQFQPNHAESREKLGFRRIGGEWVSLAQVEQQNADAKQIAKSLEIWLPKLKTIRDDLLNGTDKQRAAAKAEFDRLDDVEATPALEQTFSFVDEAFSLALIDKLAEWKDARVTRSLVMQSVYSPWENARKQAATKLKGRPHSEYVPEMLAAMRPRGEMQTLVYTDRGWLVYRDVFVQENQNEWDVLVIDNVYGQVRGPRRDPYFRSAAGQLQTRQLLQPRVAASRMKIQQLEVQQFLNNIQGEQLTERLMASLAEATEQTTLVQPHDWWNWWNLENEKETSDSKAIQAEMVRKEVLLDDPARGYPIRETPYMYNPPPLQRIPFVSSCFAAGTEVWTNRGRQAIEKVRLGDVVLSQDAETGEIALKPVMRTTIRPPVETFTIETSGGTLRSTGGHLFWVAGEGWIKARHLQSGQTLHCATGTVQVSDVTESDPAPTYNLVVADFSTYFVGPEKILTHDVTDRKPSRALVPGLLRE